MDVDDILDDMSLSDDEMLDNLADDMLMELETSSDNDEVMEEIHTVQPTRAAAARAQSNPLGFPVGNGTAGGMPDLSKMMSQMMPMMSQMFGGAGGMPNNASTQLRGPQLSWEEVVRQHAPAGEQSDWIATIKKDEQTLRQQQQLLNKPHSRSYRQNANQLPNVYMEVETLLASELNEAVRAAHCENNPKWRQYHDNLVSQLTRAGLKDVFEREFKNQLRQRVQNDPDYLAEKTKGDASRFSNITQALSV